MIKFIFYFIFCASTLFATNIIKASTLHKNDSITILKVKYKIPEFWESRKIIKIPQAHINDLRLLPDSLTYKNYNIYVTKNTYKALIKMSQAAKKEGVILLVDSGFRSKNYQKKIIERYIKKGVPFKDVVKYVAPPGYSEHMLGTALDFVPSSKSFISSESYRWLKNNASKFGFKQTYTNNNTNNLLNESWHWNYINLSSM